MQIPCLDSNFTTSVLTSPNTVSFSSIKKDILLFDFTLLLNDAASHPSQLFVHKIASSQEVSWPKALGPGSRARSVWNYLCPSCIETSLPPPSLKQYVPCSQLQHLFGYRVTLLPFPLPSLRIHCLHRRNHRCLCSLFRLFTVNFYIVVLNPFGMHSFNPVPVNPG